MKKLMIALSAAAMAFGLRAADGFVGGSNFESDTAGTIAASAITASGGAWSTTDEAATLTIATDGVFTDGTKRPAEWSKDTNVQYLNVRTAFGKPLDFALTTAQEIGEGVYFDSLVKFTACDGDDVPTTVTNNNAKLAVWIQENTDGTATNLYVCAGQYSGAGWVAATYDCGSAPEEGWHRLTIKSIANIYTTGSGSTATPGFVVYIDGTGSTGDPISTSTSTGVDTTKLTANAKGFNELGRLFPSLDQTTVNKGKIVSVGFEGQGQIDDVTITTAAPGFAKDNEYFTVVMGSNVTGFKYSLSGAAAVSASATVQLPYVAGMTVAISDVTCADGYMYDNLTIGGTPVGSSTFQPASKDLTGSINAKAAGAQVDIGGVKTPYATVAEALTALNGVQSATTATLKLFANPSGSLVIDNANLTLTIDLAGQTITGTAPAVESEKDAAIYVNAGSVTIIDSSDPSAGKVVKGDAGAAIDVSENGTVAAISGGTFDGPVYAPIGLVSGGKFSYADNNNEGSCTISATFPAGKTLVKDDDANPTYWVLGNAYAPAGTGTALDPYQIDSVKALTWVQTQVAGGETFKDKFLQQTAEIDLDGVAFAGIGIADAKDLVSWSLSGTNPITQEEAETRMNAFTNGAFRGTYDGAGYTVSNLLLKRGDYVGFINAAYGATIKNLKIATIGFEAERTADFGGAAFIGVSMDTTIENCQGSGAMTASKALAGIVGYAAGGTVVKGCENGIAITSSNEKAAGIIACGQNGNTAWGFTGIEINSCTNKGAIACTTTGKTRVAGIASYTDMVITFKGENVVDCTLTQKDSTEVQSIVSFNSGSAVLDEGVTFVVPAAYKVITDDKAVDGLFFATVEDDVATLVKNSALAAGNTYKVMAAGAAPTIELAAGASISFDTALFALSSDAGITTVSGYNVTPTTVDNVKTYTSVAASTPVTPGEEKTYDTEEEAKTATNNFEVALAPAVDAVVTDKAAYKAMFKPTITQEGEKYVVKAEFTDTAAASLQTAVDAATKAIEISDLAAAAGASDVEIANSVPGLYYQMNTASTLGDDTFTAVKEQLGTGSTITFTGVAKPSTAKGFYKVSVTAAPVITNKPE